MTLQGEFQITGWDETTLSEDGNQKVTHAQITQTYSGDLTGESKLNYIMTYLSADVAKFVGIEWLDCTINGESGRFAIQHDGKFEKGVASSQFTVILGSGSGACNGLNGNGSFTSTEGGKANFTVELA